jgi:hypothetical protein
VTVARANSSRHRQHQSTLASMLRNAGVSFTETDYFGGAKTSGGAD